MRGAFLVLVAIGAALLYMGIGTPEFGPFPLILGGAFVVTGLLGVSAYRK